MMHQRDIVGIFSSLLGATDVAIWPVNSDGLELSWTWSKQKITAESHNLLLKGSAGSYSIYKKQRVGLSGIPTRKPKSFLYSPEYSSTTGGKSAKAMLGDRVREFTPKSVALLRDLIEIGSSPGDTVLDYFAGSGTLAHAALNLSRDRRPRKFILGEVGAHFDDALVPRVLKSIYSGAWVDGRPVSRFAAVTSLVKIIRLETYEDALNNIQLERTQSQGGLFSVADGAGSEFRELYLLRYQLDVESRGSASLLNVRAFSDPTAYKLKVKSPGSDESREVNVDLLETFNWLLGMSVQQITAPRSFRAEFERDEEGRLRLKGRLRQSGEGPFWFRTVTGTTPEGRKTLVIWRKLTGEPEQDNLVLEEWFKNKQAYSVRDAEFDLIYVNGDNTLENLRVDPETWKVRLIEEDFHRLMFEGTEA